MNQADLILMGCLAIGLIAVITVVYVLLAPYLTGERRGEQRLQGVADGKDKTRSTNKVQEVANSRKRQVADTLKDLEERAKQREKVTLRKRLERAGLSVDPKGFWIASMICGVVVTGLVLLFAPNLNPIASVAVGFASAFGLPRFVLSKLIARRQNKFLDEFPNAIDVIVRGVKSGLPLNECLGIISRESPEPICTEFKIVVDQGRLGVPLGECFERLMERLPLPEVRFFGIVIGIQAQAGGNLSEALGNLSGVVRDRKRLASKVKALSAEAKASAMVLASLPFVVMILTYLSTPSYIALLWQKNYGNFMMLCGAGWMIIGLLVMRKMINFKY
jgi:tight adherence protein B